MRPDVDRARARRVIQGIERQRASATVERLRAQAGALRRMFPKGSRIPEHVKARIDEKLRTAANIERVYAVPWEQEVE